MSLKDFLEKLEIGENKVKLSKEDISGIMAESGKVVKNETDKLEEKYKTDIESYKNTINDLNDKIKNAPSSEDLENLKNQVADYENKEAQRIEQEKAMKQDQTLTNNILAVIGDKKFSSDYAKNGLLADIKSEMKKEENQGKGIKDIFEELTKDKADIFANPNQVKDMAGMDDIDTSVTKDIFDKMNYKERIEFKASNPELFAKYNN
jgi:polyhydroxyalkanoate synthesis regulator phasin